MILKKTLTFIETLSFPKIIFYSLIQEDEAVDEEEEEDDEEDGDDDDDEEEEEEDQPFRHRNLGVQTSPRSLP